MRRTPLIVAACALLLAFAVSPSSAAVRQLNQRLPELKFQGVTLGDALDFLRDVSGANISVNWKALEADGVTRDTQVNLHLTGVTLRKALNLLLSEAGGGTALTFDVDEGVIEITTQELANQKMVTRVYPVEDLIMVVPDFTDAPQFSLEAAQNGGSGGGSSSGGSGQPTVANQIFTGQPQPEPPPKSKAERAQELVDLITTVVYPDVWKDNGGTATIRYYNGMLVVTAPRAVQEAIGGELD